MHVPVWFPCFKSIQTSFIVILDYWMNNGQRGIKNQTGLKKSEPRKNEGRLGRLVQLCFSEIFLDLRAPGVWESVLLT